MLPREHPVGDRGEAVNIGPTVDQLPGQGLGGHILEGSDEESRAGEALFRWQLRVAGDAEIEQFRPLRRNRRCGPPPGARPASRTLPPAGSVSPPWGRSRAATAIP